MIGEDAVPAIRCRVPRHVASRAIFRRFSAIAVRSRMAGNALLAIVCGSFGDWRDGMRIVTRTTPETVAGTLLAAALPELFVMADDFGPRTARARPDKSHTMILQQIAGLEGAAPGLGDIHLTPKMAACANTIAASSVQANRVDDVAREV